MTLHDFIDWALGVPVGLAAVLWGLGPEQKSS